jgi:two-component system, cell cycle sensor histidine kinase and response regulator CckA
MHDETINKQREHDLHQIQKMESIGELAGVVANNINNILTVIIGACTLLEMNGADNPEQMAFIFCIQNYAERAAHLTRNLLAFNCIQTFFPQPENITDVFGDMFRFLAKVVGKNIRFVTYLPENALMAMIDRGQIEQVVMSLAAHSRDTMPMGGVLSMALSRISVDGSLPELAGYRMGDYAQITVSDTGAGIDKDILSRVFDSCFTAGESCGVDGLGLLVAHGVITHHGGFIHIRSEPDQGTTFSIYLPLCDQGECVAFAKDGSGT